MAAGMPLPLTSPIATRTPPLAMGMIWKKSPPDLACRPVDAGQSKAGNGGDFVGHEHLLHGARGFEFRLVAFFVAAGADEAKQQNGEERELNDDPGGLIRS